MKDLKANLQIPLDRSRVLLLGAGQGEAELFLNTLADVMKLECVASSANSCCRAVLLSDIQPAGENGPKYRVAQRRGEHFNVFPVANDFAEKECQSVQLRFLLCGAITLESLLYPGEFFLFHGSLLEDGNDAILLFGESGIGKSTTRNRWIEEGGSSVADDAMLCFFDGDQLYARPLPTWSDWFKNGSSSRRYPINEPRKIKSVLWLSRGRDSQYIAPVQPAVWHAQMMSAMALHSNYAMRYFTQDEKSAYLEHIWSLICRIDKIFQPRGLFAHLDHPLKPTLAEEFRK